MKEIGNQLYEARETNGVSLAEASEDLNLSENELSDIEKGDFRSFSDVYYLKGLIKNYAKYLGLDYEKMIDEFNEFLFDYTSRIPIDEINEVTKEVTSDKKIISPYTKESKKDTILFPIIIYIIIGIVILIIVYVLAKNFITNNHQVTTQTGYISK